jgi:hypothetical protein
MPPQGQPEPFEPADDPGAAFNPPPRRRPRAQDAEHVAPDAPDDADDPTGRVEYVERPDGPAVVLVKHGRRYDFPCPPGREAELMNRLAALMHEPDSGLTWFDAALLCHQVGQRIAQRLRELRRDAA